MRGSRGGRILKKGSSGDVKAVMRNDRQGVYRVWALEYEPPLEFLLHALKEVQENATEKNEIFRLETWPNRDGEVGEYYM